MKSNEKTSLLTAVVSLIGLMALGGAVSYSPVANLTERFTNNPSWKVAGAGSAAVVDQSLKLAYSSQTLPKTLVGALVADSFASSGRFVGDYSNSAITKVSFDVKRIGLSSESKLAFECNNGHFWTYVFQLPLASDVWEHRDIPITYSEGWQCDNASGAQAFDADRSQVKNINILAISEGTSSQEVRIDNFKVVGPWEKGPLTVDEMPVYWLTENGIPAQDGQAGLDKDGDGFNNFAEYLAGTDPSDEKSQFKISIEIGSDGNPVLSWKREDYRTYKVFKSANLSMADSFMEEAGSIQAVGLDNKMSVAGEAGGSSYYRVQVDKQ